MSQVTSRFETSANANQAGNQKIKNAFSPDITSVTHHGACVTPLFDSDLVVVVVVVVVVEGDSCDSGGGG